MTDKFMFHVHVERRPGECFWLGDITPDGSSLGGTILRKHIELADEFTREEAAKRIDTLASALDCVIDYWDVKLDAEFIPSHIAKLVGLSA